MTYLLDTNAWIAYLRQKNQQLVQRFMQEDPTEIALCSVVLSELFYGAHHGPANKLNANLALIARLQQQFASLPFMMTSRLDTVKCVLILMPAERRSDRTT